MSQLEFLQCNFGNVLSPFACAYSGLMKIRAQAYKRNVLKSWRPPVKCVSVGNISWGGSGKTPLCEWLLNWSIEHRQIPVLLSRGYKAHPKKMPCLVSTEDSVEEVGDESLILAHNCPKAYILVDPQRKRAGQWAWEKLQPDVFILDDGFQHLSVKRDLDLVLFKEEDIVVQWGRVIPKGSWREGTEALGRASAFVLNIEPDSFQKFYSIIQRNLLPWGVPIFSFYLTPKGFIRVFDQSWCKQLAQDKYILVSGVGSPEKVRITSTKALGREPEEYLVYPDHYYYTYKDWQYIRKRKQANRCAFILCTPKDSIKLQKMANESLWTFDLCLRFGPFVHSNMDFPGWLKQKI